MEQLERRKLSEQVFEVLKDRITKGDYEINEKLPSENAFAKEFGVSRLTIRAAIARLSAMGYVDVRNGEGTFVKEMHTSLKELYPQIADAVTLENVNEFRKMIETKCMQFAAAKAGETEIAQLRECDRKYVEYFDNIRELGMEQKIHLIDLDFEFHLLMCKLSGNPLFYMVYESAGDIIKEHMYVNMSTRWVYNRTDPNSDESKRAFVIGHTALIDALESKDNTRIKTMAKQHVDYTFTKKGTSF